MTEHLISRPAKLRSCPRCGKYTITAISGGTTVIADPAPLTINEEITALITGKTTYDIQRTALRFYLERRDMDRIKAKRCHPVVATHTCTPADPRPEPKPDIELTAVPTCPLPDVPPF